MTREEYIQQLDSLIEHFNNGGLDFNATDILAIKKLLEQNKKYKEIIDKAIAHLDLFISSENLSEYDTLKILIHAKKILSEVEDNA